MKRRTPCTCRASTRARTSFKSRTHRTPPTSAASSRWSTTRRKRNRRSARLRDELQRALQRIERALEQNFPLWQIRPLMPLRPEHEIVIAVLVDLHANALAATSELVVQRAVDREQWIGGADEHQDRRRDRRDVR